MDGHQEKPNFLVYIAFLGVFAISLNTVYLVLPNDTLRWYLMGLLVVAVMTGFILSNRHYITIGLALDVAALAVFIFYAWQINNEFSSFGTYLGEMLSVMLVLRAFKLFRYQDFLLPMIIGLTLMVFSAIPSFSAEFVYSILGFMLFLGLALFLGNIDEFARLPRKQRSISHWKYTYDFLEEYATVRVSKQRPAKLARYFGQSMRAATPAVLTAFLIASIVYFNVDHTYSPGQEAALLNAFGGSSMDAGLEGETDLLTGLRNLGPAQHYVGFDDEFNIAQGRLVENSTSTDIVMEVESNLPSYWRGKCFDTYTGRGWVQSDETLSATWSLDPPAAQRASYNGEIDQVELSEAGIRPDPDTFREEIRQDFFLRTDLPGIVFTAYQPVELSMPIPAVVIDDMFTLQSPPTADSMVAGQHYQVISMKQPAQADILIDAEYELWELERDVPQFYERHTQLPERGTMDDPDAGFDFSRLRAKSYEVTADADTIYEKVEAIIRFLKSNYHSSLNPPSAVPPELDAVDYFLFDWEARRGHCEYFSSALAVMCRSIGIPARVVTGYITGNYNLFKGRYIVQERNAHAWVEVYWVDTGWVEFDAKPTSWYEGFGEQAAGGWVAFHNVMQNLYVYDPQGTIRKKIIPAIGRYYKSGKYFLNQRELDFYEFVDPVYRHNREEPGTVLGIFFTGIAFLIVMALVRRRMDSTAVRREMIRRGGICLNRIKRVLERRGIATESLVTETDCASEAAMLSSDWGKSVGVVVDAYQEARYSQKSVSKNDLKSLSRLCRIARRVPRG